MSRIGTKIAISQAPPVGKARSTRTELTAWAGIAASVASVVLIVVVPGHGPALAGALLFACVPAGAAVMCWIDSGEGLVQAGLTLVLSLAFTAITSAVMIWLAAWHPHALLIFPFAAASSCGMRIRNLNWVALGRMQAMRRDLWLQLALLCIGLSTWAYGVSQLRPRSIGLYGLLASANAWFIIGVVALLVGGFLEMSRPEPRMWLLGTYLVGLIVAIYATVPILYGAPEYAWLYKHIGVAQALGKYGRVTDPSDIYQQWPALFAAIASVSGLAHFSPLSFAAWAPLSFELADALLLLGIFRMLGADRRVAFLALFMYEGLIAWVGQDYLSPQAFGYLLWLGIVAIMVRWLLVLPPPHGHGGLFARVRARLLTGMPTPKGSSPVQRAVAGVLISIIFFAIVAAHQLTPYMALAAIGGLALLGVLRRGWLVLFVMAVIAGGYLAPHYSMITQQFGGLFSGGNAIHNASGVHGDFHHGAEATTAEIVRTLSISMWLSALAVVVANWRTLGRVATTAVLAFSPFMVLFMQAYGGEAIIRVFLFSAPWCAFIIAGALAKLRSVFWRQIVSIFACSVALAAGLQGLYGPTSVDAFTPTEVAGSLWLYEHAAPGSLLVLAVDNFPTLEVPDYYLTNLQAIPADPQKGTVWLDEANVTAVQAWIASLGYQGAYVVFSSNMAAYADYFGAPYGYAKLANIVRNRPGWSLVYHNANTTIYYVRIGQTKSGSQNARYRP